MKSETEVREFLERWEGELSSLQEARVDLKASLERVSEDLSEVSGLQKAALEKSLKLLIGSEQPDKLEVFLFSMVKTLKWVLEEKD